MRVLQWLYGAPGTGEQRGWVLSGTWMGAGWGVVWGEVGRNVCVLCGEVFGRGRGRVVGWFECGLRLGTCWMSGEGLGTVGVCGWRGAGWVVCGEKWWKSVCLRVWGGAGDVVVCAVCMCVAVPCAYEGVEEERMSGWMGWAGHG